jgi:NAD(P)-dependent dehydrogenase (short-subunit alcohol dehydrogenase family)
VSNLVGSIGQEGATTYVATKGAITGFTKALALDEARHDVRVNAVLPGNICTSMFLHFVESHEHPEEARNHFDSWHWVARVGTPEEVGHACLFFASDEASFITGVELVVSGGAELAYGIKWPKKGRRRTLFYEHDYIDDWENPDGRVAGSNVKAFRE